MKRGTRHRRRQARTPIRADEFGFQIESLDLFGQGVFREGGQIGFIPKTLPGERGQARLIQVRKGVRFARLMELEESSPERIQPACPHYGHCPGCHYLHTSYAMELRHKEQALRQQLRGLLPSDAAVQIHPAAERQGYRNRLQLHVRGTRLGLIDAATDEIVEIPGCPAVRSELLPALAGLYAERAWPAAREGHCELYVKDGAVQVTWNQPYAHGGFTQVNEAMNQVLRQLVTAWLQDCGSRNLLDLFAGDGNLSQEHAASAGSSRLRIDLRAGTAPDLLSLDLYAPTALAQFRRLRQGSHFDTLLLDPPRRGFPALSEWLDHCRPRHLIYVSCNAATLARDLNALTGYRLEHVALLDLFPGTHHFETLVLARRVQKDKRGSPDAGVHSAADAIRSPTPLPRNDMPAAKHDTTHWPAMDYRVLGNTGFRASRLVFGCGAALMRGQAEALLEPAFEAGVNVFDVGWRGYYHEAEKTLGGFVRRHRDQIFLISKAIAGDELAAGAQVSVSQARQAAAVWTERLEGSLLELGVDHVDAYYLMASNNPALIRSDEIRLALETARDRGKTSFLGLSTHENAEQVLLAAVDTGLFSLAQIAITPAGWYDWRHKRLLENSPPLLELQDLLTALRAAGIGLIAMKAARFLAGPAARGLGDERAFDRFYPKSVMAAGLNAYQRSYAYVLAHGLDAVNSDIQEWQHLRENHLAAATAEQLFKG